ncbi:Oxidoreductase-like domain-containing protein [Trichinella spiralis]|uniref:Oxidoreductase-like domain-containing protein n=1 Tax=Trichinella spiralis TaxID=6334 RepID=A0ABR3KV28_TRISP
MYSLSRYCVRLASRSSEAPYQRLAQLAKLLSETSLHCCGGGCPNCIWLSATDQVLKLCDGLEPKVCKRMINENVENSAIRIFLLSELETKSNDARDKI